MNYYIFTSNDVLIDHNKTISVQQIVSELTKHNIWLLNANTPYRRKLKAGDQVLIYICGPNRRYFKCVSTIASSASSIGDHLVVQEIRDRLGLAWFEWYIKISEICFFETPISIKPLINSLEFIKNKKNYGLNLRLPVVSISEKDFELIVQS